MKHTIALALLALSCGGAHFDGFTSSSSSAPDDAGGSTSSSGGELGAGGTSSGGTSSSGGARTSTGGELGADDAGAACVPDKCPQCAGPVLGCCAVPSLGGPARCGCPFQAGGRVICGL